MTRLVEFAVGKSETICVEVDEPAPAGVVKTSTGSVLETIQVSLEASFDKLRVLAQSLLEKLHDVGPDAVEIELGVRLDTKAGIVLAQAGTGTHLKVKMSWKRPRGTSERSDR